MSCRGWSAGNVAAGAAALVPPASRSVPV